MGNTKTEKMGDKNGQSSVDSIRQQDQTQLKPEKVDINIHEIIRVFPDKICEVIDSFQKWSSQFK